VDGTATPDGHPDPARSFFMERLAELRNDPSIRGLAQRRDRGLGLVEDILNEAYETVARHGPEGIQDLRAYYCQSVIHAAYALGRQFARGTDQNFEEAVESHQDRTTGQQASRSVCDTAIEHALGESWLNRFTTQRAQLTDQVKARSPQPQRYKILIVTIAERVLRATITRDVCDADSNPELAAAYPEWFADPGCSADTRYQRFSRARGDVKDVLRCIVNREDLDP
jgi:hypothetical protein